MDYLSFIPVGIPAQSRLVYRPVYPQVVVPSGEDSHDGVDELFRKRDEEIKEARQRLRDQLRNVVLGVTGRPPDLEASAKQLASIARKSESFDYRAALAEISRIESEAKALAQEREAAANAQLRLRVNAAIRKRRQEEEALMLLLLT